MPITIKCATCKRALTVPDELMGRKVKCPACKLIFTATPPGAGPAKEPPVPRPRPGSESEAVVRRKPPPRPPVEVEDEDDEEEEERPRVRKKPVRRREEDDEEEEKPRVRQNAVRRKVEDEDDDEDEDEDEEEEERPRRRRKRVTGSRQRAESAVLAPAICLMVTGGLGLAAAIALLALNLGLISVLAAQDQGDEQEGKVQWVSSQARSIRGSISSICWGLAILGGGIQMKKLKGFKSVVTSCILAMLPCNICCILGIPFGIWGLIAINRWDVKREFD